MAKTAELLLLRDKLRGYLFTGGAASGMRGGLSLPVIRVPIKLVNWQQEEPTDRGEGQQLFMDGTSRVIRGSSTVP
jgi:hypothetical protein